MSRKNYFELLGLPCDGSLENTRGKSRGSALDGVVENVIKAWKEKLTAEKNMCSDSAKRSAIDKELSMEGEIRSALTNKKDMSAEAQVENAIKAWRSKLESEKAGGTAASDAKRRAEIDAELALEPDIRTVMLDKKSRRAEANDMIKLCQDKLRELLDIQLFNVKELPDMTEMQVKSVAERLRIPYDKAAEVYAEKGMKVVKPQKAADLKQYFLDDATFGNITGLLQRLKEDKWIKGTPFENTARASDLYGIACYIEGGSDKDVSLYRKKSTKALKDIMDKQSVSLASDSGSRSYAAILRDLVSIGASKVFDSEENRAKYAHSIQKDSLTEFFRLLRQAPVDFKKDRNFAENCIKRIQAYFPDYNIALALYNEKAGLNRDPYVRIDHKVGVVCGTCQSYTEFGTSAEAERSMCPACGAKLYIPCPSCSKKVPASADYCSCGFHISEIKNLGEYISGAQRAISRLDLREAEYFITSIEAIDPKNTKLPSIKKLYSEKAAAYKKPLEELEALMSSRQYSAAEEKLRELTTKNKELDMESARSEIRARLREADEMMPSPKLSPTQKGNVCWDILSKCADHRLASALIATVPLQTPKGLKANVIGNTCELSWTPSPDKGAVYRIVRKRGGVPESVSDGELIGKDITQTAFTDKTMESGVICGYGVFAERLGVISAPATVKAESLGDLDKVSLVCSSEPGLCSFSWTLPTNALGVRILRSKNSQAAERPDKTTLCIAEQEISGYRDTDVINGMTYGYRLQAVYAGNKSLRYSKGITVRLRPDEPPEELRDLSVRHKGTSLEIKWKKSERTQTVTLLRLLENKQLIDEGDICQSEQLSHKLGKTEILATAMSESGKCSASLSANITHRLALTCTSGSVVRVCRIMTLSTAEPCDIDAKNTFIKNNILTIRLQNVSSGLKRIYYAANRKREEKAVWCTTEDIRQGNMLSISPEDYKAKGCITVDVPEDDIYITVIGEYESGGETICSDPSRLKRNNLPKARIYYKLTTALLGGQHTLKVKSSAAETPEMYLVYSENGVPNDYTAKDSVLVMTIPGNKNNTPNSAKDYPISQEAWNKIPNGAKLRLLIDKLDTFDYEMAPQNVSSLLK